MNLKLRIIFLVTLTFVVYSNALRNDFTHDDGLYISNNPQVTNPSMRGLFGPNKTSNVFRPVTMASFALDWELYGGHPFGFHLVNVLLHAAVTLLLYMLLLAILGQSPQIEAMAFVTACIFAVHPIHTEAVSSISGRSELLAAGFLLAAWIFHLRDREIPALICFLLALLSKESAVVFFPLVVISDYVRGKWKPSASYAAVAAVTLLYLGLLWKVQGGRFGQPRIAMLDNPLAGLPVGWRILNALRVAWKYVGLHVYPATLSYDYSFNQIPIYLDWRHTLPAALAALAIVVIWVWAIQKKQGALILAGAIYFAGFATTANVLIPTGTIFGERLAYLPSAGFCLLVAMGWNWIKNRQRMVAFGLVATIVGVLAVRTVARNADWQNDMSLYKAGAQAAPGSAKTHANLGNQYIAYGQTGAARTELQTALRIYPDYVEAIMYSGVLDAGTGQNEAAAKMFAKALDLSGRDNPNYDFMEVSLAVAMVKTGHVDDALAILNRVIVESPENSHARSDRAVIYYKKGDATSARSDLEVALRLDPANLDARKLMALLGPAPQSGSVQ